jgi:hypothetical protein
MSSKRFFTVVTSSTNKDGGRYAGSTPARAARHAARVLLGGKDNGSTTFTIRETTRGSANKSYEYTATIRKLANPKVTTITGKEIKESHDLKVKPVSK